MANADTCCSLVPYFEVPEDKMAEFKTLVGKFVERTKSESGCLFYAFSFSGQTAHCREGYEDATALLNHLENVGEILQEALKIAKISRLEVHGPEKELEKLRGPLGALNPQWFTLVAGGIRR